MARARNIKPSIFKNELLGVDEASPFLTILFESLWCLADREGRLEDRPLRIKAETFPYRTIALPVFNGYLTELQQLGFIRRYSVDEKAIIQVINFDIHQNPHSTEKNSILPAEPAESLANTQVKEITVNPPLFNDGLTQAERSDSGFLIPDSPLLLSAGEGSATPPEGKNGTSKPPSLPKKIEEEITTWLNETAKIIGAKDGKALADYRKWREVIEKAVREERPLMVWLSVARTEFMRTRETPQYFTPNGVLRIVQAQGATSANGEKHEWQAAIENCDRCDEKGIIFNNGQPDACNHKSQTAPSNS